MVKDEKYSGFQKISRVLIPALSLLTTFLILYLLFENITAINEGDHSEMRFILTIVESISLFLIPFIFNPKAVNKRINRRNRAKITQEKNLLELKIKKLVKLDGHYTPAIVLKCPNCKFVSTKKTKICYNCGYKLNWGMKEQNATIIMKCPKCSFTITRKTKICNNCGYKLIEN